MAKAGPFCCTGLGAGYPRDWMASRVPSGRRAARATRGAAGDTVAALRKAEVLETEVSHVSTGGGASLQYIGGEDLAGLAVLSKRA